MRKSEKLGQKKEADIIELEKELGLTYEDYQEFKNCIEPGTLTSKREYEVVRVTLNDKMQDYFDM